MSVNIPNPINVDADLSGSIGSVGPISVDPVSVAVGLSGSLGTVGPVTVSGIPSSFDITASIDKIPTIAIDIDSLPKIQLSPVSLDVSIKSLPSIRVHLPANYRAGLSLFGFELFSIRFCGEGQIITEPYVPNPCERCGPVDPGTPPANG